MNGIKRVLAVGILAAAVVGSAGVSHQAQAASVTPPQHQYTFGINELPRFYWGGGYDWQGHWVTCLYSDTTHRALYCI